MKSINQQLIVSLKNVQRPGNYYVTGFREIYMPQLSVQNIGQISFPVQETQLNQLIDLAEAAPYGKGEKTIIDKKVRRTWQFNDDQIDLNGKHWDNDLASILNEVKEEFGASCDINAELYKLLIYDKDSFFVQHRDTEKTEAMFATLVIVLPSIYQGGQLIVRHQDQEAVLDLQREETSEIAFAAFYADCKHEVLPVTDGCRLTLVYNLSRQDKKALSQPPNYLNEQQHIINLLKQWTQQLTDNNDLIDNNRTLQQQKIPEKIIYLLEHAYSLESLSFSALKGADAAISETLVSAAQQADCEVYLTLVSIEESGTAEYYGGYSSNRYGHHWSNDDSDDFEIDEVYDSSELITHWLSADGTEAEIDKLPFEAFELCPENAFESMEPDELEFEEATGNEGASFERSYRRSAIVIWPKSQHLAIINQAGLSTTIPYLKEISQQFAKSKSAEKNLLQEKAHLLALLMIKTWPSQGFQYHPSRDKTTNVIQLLNTLIRLKDVELIDLFISSQVLEHNHETINNTALIKATKLLPPERTKELLTSIIDHNAEIYTLYCVRLLSDYSQAKYFSKQPELLTPAIDQLLKKLPGDPSRSKQQNYHFRSPSIEQEFVIELVQMLKAIDSSKISQAIDTILKWPDTYLIDEILVTSSVQLIKENLLLPELDKLNRLVKEHLSQRIAAMIDEPTDWKRNNKLSCKCQDCQSLSHFLADPEQEKWNFKAAENRRSHLESMISNGHIDVDLQTEKKSRPYSMVCIKNIASYNKRLQQHKNDLQNLDIIEQATA